jgi:hypothetical protein
MKYSVLFVLFASALIIKENFGEKSVKENVKKDEKSSVAAAIGEILEKFYSKKDHRVDVLCYPCKTTKSAALFNEITKNSKIEVAFRAIKPNEKIQIDASTIMIFDSKAEHDKLMDKLKFEKISSNEHYHIIYYPEMIRNGIKTTAGSKYKNINYIYDLNRTHLCILTFEYFHENDCDKERIKTTNNFIKATRKWNKNDDFFPDKFKNFQGCELNFGIRVGLFGLGSNNPTNKAPKAGETFGGKNYEINEAITKKLNIKSKYLTCPQNKTSKQFVCPNKTEMFLEINFTYEMKKNAQPNTNLEYFNFENYAGFFIPPGELIDRESIIIFI